ncbi:MAG: hypothetical protein HY327_08310 [Chloroflexi bacterium]|nr:hypothetical protein [Chloroflexota bacterium]
MLQVFKTFIKLAIDVERGIVAGGSEMHYQCEQVLLDAGSRQEDIWGADWLPDEKTVKFEALINIRPRQNNRSMVIQDAALRSRIEKIVRAVFGGAQE